MKYTYEFTYVMNYEKYKVLVEAPSITKALKELSVQLKSIDYDYVGQSYKIIDWLGLEESRTTNHSLLHQLNQPRAKRA